VAMVCLRAEVEWSEAYFLMTLPTAAAVFATIPSRSAMATLPTSVDVTRTNLPSTRI
jgi:hypothetical protein